MRIYFTVDEKNRVFPCCDWNESIVPDPDWIDSRVHDDWLAYNDYGIPLLKYSGGIIIQRTAAEIAEDMADLPPDEPTEMDQVHADIDFLTMENDYLEETVEQQQADIDYCLMLLDEE